MWDNPATQRNVATLTVDGVTLIGPGCGDQACGETGEGRMLEAEEICEDLIAFLQPKLLAGKKVLITAGPTFEAIDPVRGITNLSSGKMGFAVARAAREAGADVTLIAGPSSQPTPRGITRINVTGTLEMRARVMERAGFADIFIGVAAVADYRPKLAAEHKIKKDGNAPPVIELVQNPDILAEVAALPNPPLCVGFAAESQNLAEYAQKKRLAKNIPLIAGNLIQHGFGGEENTLILFDANGQTPLPPGPKTALARALVAHIARLLTNR
jgi:phosphopantothenoylcysteine decarboxylase/phosphopantothenate--cysteine ligase